MRLKILRRKFQNFSSQPLVSVGLAIRVYPQRLPGLPSTTAVNKLPLLAPTPHAHPQLPVAEGVKLPFELLPTPQAQVQLPATSNARQSVVFLPTQQASASAGISLLPQPHAQFSVAGAHHQSSFLAATHPQAQIPASTGARPVLQAPLLEGVQHRRLPGLVAQAATHTQAQILASAGVKSALQAPLVGGAQHHRLPGLVSPHIHVPVAEIDQKYAATGKFSV
jgi:hypothetical protein